MSDNANDERMSCGHPRSALRSVPYIGDLYSNWCSLCEYAAEQEPVQTDGQQKPTGDEREGKEE